MMLIKKGLIEYILFNGAPVADLINIAHLNNLFLHGINMYRCPYFGFFIY